MPAPEYGSEPDQEWAKVVLKKQKGTLKKDDKPQA